MRTKILKRSILALFVPVIAILVIGISSVVMASGPDRASFKSAEPADYPVFNSIVDNPLIGNEKNFLRIREAGVGLYGDEVELVPGKEYEVYIWFHNNAKDRLNDIATEGGIGIAWDVRLNAVFPQVVRAGERAMITSLISSSNTTPKEVWDEVFVTSTQDVELTYVPGSAIIHSNGAVNGKILPSSLFSEKGTFIGYDALDGVLPGCTQYAGYVIYRISVGRPAFTVNKTVSIDGVNFSDKVSVAPGKEVTFKIVYANTGTSDQANVNIKDTLPDYMAYMPGSTILTNGTHPNGLKLDEDVSIITGGGINIGNYGKGTSATITFRAKIAESKDLPCGIKHLTNIAYVITGNGTKEDDAHVDVTKTCELPKTGPIDLLLIGGAIVTAVVVVAYLIQWKMGKKKPSAKKSTKRPTSKKK